MSGCGMRFEVSCALKWSGSLTGLNKPQDLISRIALMLGRLHICRYRLFPFRSLNFPRTQWYPFGEYTKIAISYLILLTKFLTIAASLIFVQFGRLRGSRKTNFDRAATAGYLDVLNNRSLVE
jgi:hypothetical protein